MENWHAASSKVLDAHEEFVSKNSVSFVILTPTVFFFCKVLEKVFQNYWMDYKEIC